MDELSDTKIRNAKPADKEFTLADGQGLSVVMRPTLWPRKRRPRSSRKPTSKVSRRAQSTSCSGRWAWRASPTARSRGCAARSTSGFGPS